MDLWLWVAFWPHTWQALTVVFAQGLSFQAAHAIGNVVIALAIGPELRLLSATRGDSEPRWSGHEARFRSRRSRPRCDSGRLCRVAPAARRRLRRAGRRSDPSLTAWAVLGLTAAGREPGRSPADISRAGPPDANDLALRILALDALGRNTEDVTRLEGMRGPDGRIGTLVNSTIWGVIALRAADVRANERPLSRSAPSAERRLVVVSEGRARLERHGRRDPGAACGRRGARASRSAGRSAICATSSGRTAASRSAGVARRMRSPRRGRSRHSSRPAAPGPRAFRYLAELAGRRQLSLLEAIRGDARLGHVAGSGRARPAPFPLR